MVESSTGVPSGLRERKKRETRERLGDVAARLFAEHGYDEVSMSDVARAAGVSDQTVYNYFPTKPDLVFDRADEVLEKIRAAVADRGAHQSPAEAMRTIVLEDVDRYVAEDPALARGSSLRSAGSARCSVDGRWSSTTRSRPRWQKNWRTRVSTR